MAEIYILTGKTNSGKTTALEKLVGEYPEKFSGVLCPKIRGERHAFLIREKQTIFLEATNLPDNEVLKVGQYVFAIKAFKQINRAFMDALSRPGEVIIFDEIGPLELSRRGFYESLQNLLKDSNPSLKALLVIREKLLEESVRFFNLKPKKIFSGKDIHTLKELLGL